MYRLFELMRRYAYWAIDLAQGGNVRSHLVHIRSLLDETSGDEYRREESRQLAMLLDHAVSTVPYYSVVEKGSELECFPVVNKSIIRNNFDSFRSSAFAGVALYRAVTSGSTGTPFVVFHDAEKRRRNTADVIYFANRVGFRIGHRLVYLKIWSEANKKSALVQRRENVAPLDVLNFAEEQVQNLLAEMDRGSHTYGIVGYASALDVMARYIMSLGGRRSSADVRSIIAIAEALAPETAQVLEAYFDTPVYSRYSNLENGIIAQQVPGSQERFLINTASYMVEVLEMEDDCPAPVGSIGRIVLTDLYNWAMPMIRYDTGDLGALYIDDNTGLRYFEKVEGRKMDALYDTSGNLVSSFVVYKNMWKYTEIDQYQLVQKGEKEYIIILNISGPFTREQEMVNEFVSYLGADASIKIEYVSEISLLASGKRKKILNLYRV